MLKSVEWAEDRDYKTGSEYEPVQFYLDALCNSKSFDLLLGYFSSSALNVLSIGFANFIHSGGKMRAVINNVLSEEDKKAIEKGQNKNELSTIYNFNNVRELKASLDEYGKHFFECFAWLIANDRIEIKIIKPKDGKGISHYKSGVFSDGVDSVSYKSSCNFTYYGFVENLEELECRLSWEDDSSQRSVNKQTKYFEKIFSGKSENVEYLNIEDVKAAILDEFGNKSLKELLGKEKDLMSKRDSIFDNIKVKNSIYLAMEQMNAYEKTDNLPRFPYSEGPRDYQAEASNNWIKNDKKGLFAMATGTGKTITALNCILKEYKSVNNYRAIIIVPTISLVAQWIEEVDKFNFKNVIAVSSKTNWEKRLSSTILSTKLNKNHSFVIITTYASFHRQKFQSFFKRIPGNTIFIADEAHNLGSKKILELLANIHLTKRIGLSATPKRIYDNDGNIKIEEFFNDKSPFIFEYSMKKAIENGVLCNYVYHPHLVFLHNIELNEYSKISKKLAQFFDSKTGAYKKNKIVEILLLKRKRIIHKAIGKEEVFKKIITEEFNKREELNYALVYVPEGIEPDYSEVEVDDENEDDIKLIDNYTRIVSSVNSSIIVSQFTGQTKNRNEILNNFSNGRINVLTSMKCLDEGVDIPRTELAFFCSSTGNPRQFIQRRGRILRTHKDKKNAIIHDLIVVPKLFNNSDITFEMEKSLVTRELERVVNFAFLSMNKYDTFTILKKVLNHYNISLFEIEENLNQE